MSDTTITRPGHVKGLLESMRRHGLLLRLDPGDPAGRAPSTLLEIDAVARRLVLDAPRPEQQAHYPAGGRLSVETDHEGIQLLFRSRIRAMGEHHARPALWVDWPGEIEYQQRRRSFRVRVHGVSDAQLDLFVDGRYGLRAKMVDVSAEGFAALVAPGALLSTGDRIESCARIDDNVITATAEIRNLKRVNDDRHLRIGSRFLDLDRCDRQRLERLVRELERRTIRQLNGDPRQSEGPANGTRRR